MQKTRRHRMAQPVVFPLNWGRGKAQPAAYVAGPLSKKDLEKSPTGSQFSCLVLDEGVQALRRLLQKMCLESETEPAEPLLGIGLYNFDTGGKVPGGLSYSSLQKMDDWWYQWSPLKGAILWDKIFQSEVIEPDLFGLSLHYYHKMNLCLLSQIFGSAIPEVEEYARQKYQKHQAQPSLGMG